MNRAIVTSQPQSIEVQKVYQQQLKERRKKDRYMQDVLLIIDNLFEREEATVMVVLDCLYEVGSINLINKKIFNLPLNRLAKFIAKFSKPVFRVVAIRWFKKNVPTLITNWLGQQVSFKSSETKIIAEVPVSDVNALSEVKKVNSEVRRLRSQVRLLTGCLVAAIALSILVTFR